MNSRFRAMGMKMGMGALVLVFCSLSARAAVVDGGGGGGGPAPTYEMNVSVTDMWLIVGLRITGRDGECAAGRFTGSARIWSATNSSSSGDAQFLYYSADQCLTSLYFNKPQGWGTVTVHADFKLDGQIVVDGEYVVGTY